MKKLIIALFIVSILSSCSVKLTDDEINIDAWNLGSINLTDDEVNVESGKNWKVEKESNISIKEDINKLNEFDEFRKWFVDELSNGWININIEEKTSNSLNKKDKTTFYLSDYTFYVSDSNWTRIFNLDSASLNFKLSDWTRIVNLDSASLNVKYDNWVRIISIDSSSLRVRNNTNNSVIYISDHWYDNEWWIEDFIDFDNWLKVGKLSINDTLKIKDILKFTSNSLIIWDYEIKESGLYKNWNKIRSLSSLKNENFEITKDWIKYGDNISITRGWIKFNDKIINKNTIKFSEKTYLEKNKIFFNWEEK